MAVNVETLYRKYGPMVLRRCRTLLNNEDRALDTMQDTFVQVLKHQERLTAAGPSSLLYRIATNLCLNVLRSDRRRPQTRDDEILLSIAGTEDHEKMTITRHFLDRVFLREKPSTRTIAVLHYVDGMTLEEVAREVGLSVSGVRKRLRSLQARVKSLPEEVTP